MGGRQASYYAGRDDCVDGRSWGKLYLKRSKNGENGTGGVQPTTGRVADTLSLLQASISDHFLSTSIDIL
jgi:hypothetical protein